MKLNLRVKPGKLQPNVLQPIVGPIGLVSKDIIKELESKMPKTNAKRFLFTLDIDVAKKSYQIIFRNQPDSLVLKSLSQNNNILYEKVEELARNTMHKSYAYTIEGRLKEILAIAKGIKLNVIK
jgi:ribosomal protein L11